jgi:hypothetical protein
MSHPARRRRTRRGALVLTGAVLLVCCVGAGGLGLWNYQFVRQSSGPARDTADAFLRELSAGDSAAAYDRLCGATRDRWSREGLAQLVIARGKISRYAIRDVALATERGRMRGTVTAELTRESGAVDSHKLTVIKDEGRWVVCGDPF